MQDEGSLPAKPAHKQPKLENHIITGAEHFGSSRLYKIVRREQPYCKVNPGECVRQSFDKGCSQAEEALIPERDIGILLQQRSNGTRKFQDRKSTRLNSSHLGISYAV